jgi:Flp pilus assembly protein TadB
MVSFRKKENSSASKELRNALKFTAPGLEPYEIALTAYILSMVTFTAMVVVDAVILFLFPMDLLGMVLFILIPTTVIPLAVLSILGTYPKVQARRLRNKALGRLPEAINYLVMSMRLTPSLDKAINFAADNLEEPLSTAMKRILWNVYMRKHHSIEESFVHFSYDWGDWNEDFKRALYTIRSAELERTHEGLCRGLDKATEIILTGTKQTMEAYTSKLAGPTFVLFSMGILLPMILGAMLPMMSIGGLSIGTVQLVLIMDVAFPLITFAYAFSILGNRPGTATPPRLVEDTGALKRMASIGAIGIFVILLIPMVPPLDAILSLGYLPLLWAITGGISFFALYSSYKLKRKRDKVKKLEREFPDALFQLGSRISEGKPLEAAMERTSDTMKGTLIAKLFHRIARVLQLTRTSLDEALFGRSGVIKDHPSRTIKATMRTVVEVVKKDAVTAGQTIVGISHYLRDMKRVEHEINSRLNNVMGMMSSTALVFAPVVMGVTSALYYVMATVIAGLENVEGGGFTFGTGGPVVPYDLFTFILGIYLLLTVLVITYFVSGMKEGDDPVELRFQIGRTVPVALVIFTVASLVGGMMVQ